MVDGNKFVFHKVSSRDTIKSIIHRYHISEADLRTWNELTGDLVAGEEYIVQLSIKIKPRRRQRQVSPAVEADAADWCVVTRI